MEFIAKVFALIAVAILGVIGIGAFVFTFSAIGAFFTMVAVNYLFNPAVLVLLFGVAKLTFWKAFALDFVFATLFGAKTVSSK